MKAARFLAALPLALMAACQHRQSVLAPAGEQAGSLLSLLQLMVWVCGGVFALVLCFLGWSIVRMMRAPASEPPRVDPDDRGLNRAMLVWAGMIVAGLTVLITSSFLVDRGFARMRDRETLDVRVTGHQWWWRIAYRDPASGRWVESANELHLPIGRTARVELASSDVIHSFWVPNVAGKLDMIPGRSNSIDLTPRKLGTFRGQCAEFCGAQHAQMAFDVTVQTEEAFRQWLAVQARPAASSLDAQVARGRAIVTQGPCAMCHVVRGTGATGRAGPDLTHVAGRRSIAAGVLPMSRAALQGWVSDPAALKPGTSMPAVPLDGQDLDAVGRYLETLK